MARGVEPTLGLEWETDQDLRNRDPRIRLRLSEKALDLLSDVAAGDLLFEVEIPVEDREGGYPVDTTVVIEISRVD